jgi:hypothetical protein
MLIRHPDRPCAPVQEISVEIRRQDAGLSIDYHVTGDLAGIALPGVTAAERADHLWRHSCLEVFARVVGEQAYHEFNFAPSTHWAAYRFDSRRAGMANLDVATAPAIAVTMDKNALHMRVAIDDVGLASDLDWQIGLSAIIETTNGALSFWALRHPDGDPDFHHTDCFALTLAPMEAL